MSEQNHATKFAVCIDNSGNEVSLEIGKLYEIVNDQEAARHGYLRVIDESGEDYWHAASMFYLMDVPGELANTLHKVYASA